MSRTVEITTNIGCPLACPYCPQSVLRSAWRRLDHAGPATLTLDAFRGLLATVPTQVDVHFSGFAEPWHAPECTAMVLHALDRGHRVAIFTTGDLMSVEDVQQLSSRPFKRFVVHLPNASGELRVRLTEAHRERLLALRAGIPELEFLTLGVLHPTVRGWLGRTASTRRVHSRAGNVGELEGQVGSAFSAAEIAARTRGAALACRQDRMHANVLLPNGDVHWCAMDYGLEHRLGNLHDHPWNEIVNGAVFHELLDRMRTPAEDLLCRRCEYAVPASGQAW